MIYILIAALFAAVVVLAWFAGRYGLRKLRRMTSYWMTPPDVKASISRVLESSEFWREEFERISSDLGMRTTGDLSSAIMDAYTSTRLASAAVPDPVLVERDKQLRESIESDEIGYRRLSPTYWDGLQDIDYFRWDARRASRFYSLHDPLMHRSVWLPIFYIWGRGVVGPKADDAEVQKIIDAFMDDKDNELVTRVTGQWRLSQALIEDGELFLAAHVDKRRGRGRVKISMIVPDEIQQIIPNPTNADKIEYFRRLYSPVSYDIETGAVSTSGLVAEIWPEWGCEELTPGADSSLYECECGGAVDAHVDSACPKCGIKLTEAALTREIPKTGTEKSTVGNFLFGRYLRQYKTNSRTQRGMPSNFASIPYAKAYKGFLQDRIVLLIALATFAFKSKIKGNRRALQRVVNDWGSMLVSRWGGVGSGRSDQENSPGSQILVENDAMATEQFKTSSGSSEAYLDARMIRQGVAAGAGITEADLTGDATTGNLASMTAMAGPQLKGFEWWQTYFKYLLIDIYELVINSAIQFGDLSPVYIDENGETVKRDLSFEIDFPPIVTKEIPTFISSISQLISAQTTAKYEFVSKERIAKYILQAFGEEDIDAAMEELSGFFGGDDNVADGGMMPGNAQAGDEEMGFPDAMADSLSSLREAVEALRKSV